MLLQVEAYFDESGTHAPSHLVTLAGVLTTPKRWRALERGWRRVLQDEGVSEFKASDCDTPRDEFDGWSEHRRVRFRQRLAAEIDHWVDYAVAVSAVADDYRKEIWHRIGTDHELRDPYVFCMQTCLEFIFKDQWGTRKGRLVCPIFDAGHRTWEQAQAYYQRIRTKRPGWSRAFAARARTGDSRHVIPLQVADFIAYEMRFWTDRSLISPGLRDRPDLSRFIKRLAIQGGFMDRKSLRKWIRQIEDEEFPALCREAAITIATWEELLRNEAEAC